MVTPIWAIKFVQILISLTKVLEIFTILDMLVNKLNLNVSHILINRMNPLTLPHVSQNGTLVPMLVNI